MGRVSSFAQRSVPHSHFDDRGELPALEKRVFVTTSWDDGDRADLKLAELLGSRGMQGTFYVPVMPFEHGRPTLDSADLKSLAQDFEIGAHGLSHKLLWGLGPEELNIEAGSCKPILEDMLGREVGMFCYPRGRFDANVIRTVRAAGYWGARTVRMLSTRPEFSPFEMPTSLQAFPHPTSNYIKNLMRARRIEGARRILSPGKLCNWVELGKELFDSVLERGGIWHLYGHSWELDTLDLWDDLKRILDYVGGRTNVTYASNWQVLKSLPGTARKDNADGNLA